MMMKRSRRLLFVLSPDFLLEKSFHYLELRVGLVLLQQRRASLVSVVLRSVRRLCCPEIKLLRLASVGVVSWRGRRSEPQRSRFWLRLRLALPVRPLALRRRLIDGPWSQSDLTLHQAPPPSNTACLAPPPFTPL
ncbi:interleukin-1 receptor accessory protein-like [Gouania willdenowi]|uniref:interleukin-1 receptor accessory protein-like n=1 Tax=Gouania willdenowi TaxID=441366 RepID=UPI0010558FA7|nr:interleukin-1 receptor accessory protein-like [Gouania willdenowi]